MTSHAEKTQRQTEFDFDHAALLRCVALLKPKALKTVFGGLLHTAASEPHRVADICEDGYMLMAAPIDVVASYAGVHERTLQRNRDKLVRDGLLNCQQPPNTPCEWFFRLPEVLPPDAVQWFISLVENGEMPPRQNENATPAKNFATPAIATPRDDKCHPGGTIATPANGVANGFPTSTCFLSIKAQLAELLGSAGSAVEISGSWNSLRVPDDALRDPDAVQLLYRLAVELQVIPDTPVDRAAVFRCAVVAMERDGIDWPVSWFRRAIAERWHVTTGMSKPEQRAGDALMRRADGASAEELMPEVTSDEAWQLVINAMIQHDFRYEPEALRERLPADVYAAARQITFLRFADSRPGASQRDLRREFAATLGSIRDAIQLTGAMPELATPPAVSRSLPSVSPKTRFVPAPLAAPSPALTADEQAARKHAALQELRNYQPGGG